MDDKKTVKSLSAPVCMTRCVAYATNASPAQPAPAQLVRILRDRIVALDGTGSVVPRPGLAGTALSGQIVGYGHQLDYRLDAEEQHRSIVLPSVQADLLWRAYNPDKAGSSYIDGPGLFTGLEAQLYAEQDQIVGIGPRS